MALSYGYLRLQARRNASRARSRFCRVTPPLLGVEGKTISASASENVRSECQKWRGQPLVPMTMSPLMLTLPSMPRMISEFIVVTY